MPRKRRIRSDKFDLNSNKLVKCNKIDSSEYSSHKSSSTEKYHKEVENDKESAGDDNLNYAGDGILRKHVDESEESIALERELWSVPKERIRLSKDDEEKMKIIKEYFRNVVDQYDLSVT